MWQEPEYPAGMKSSFARQKSGCSKCVFLHCPCGIGDKSCKSSLSPENQWSNEPVLSQKNNFSGSQALFFFLRFSVLTDPWWNEIELCQKNTFLEAEKVFFLNTCLHCLQASQNHSKSIFGNLKSCLTPIT